MNKVFIRRATFEELPIIQNLNLQLFQHDQVYDPLLNMNYSFSKNGKKYFQDKISNKDSICLVAEINNQIIGYLAGGITKSYSYRTVKKQSELENTLVLKEYRGKGIGNLLFCEFVKWSKKQGVEIINVKTSTDNIKAIEFYKKEGFVSYSSELEYQVK